MQSAATSVCPSRAPRTVAFTDIESVAQGAAVSRRIRSPALPRLWPVSLLAHSSSLPPWVHQAVPPSSTEIDEDVLVMQVCVYVYMCVYMCVCAGGVCCTLPHGVLSAGPLSPDEWFCPYCRILGTTIWLCRSPALTLSSNRCVSICICLYLPLFL